MPKTREIDRPRWPEFLHRLSELEQDKPVRVQVAGPELGNQPLGQHLSLVGIDVEEAGQALGAIDLTFATEKGPFRHQVARPEHVYLEENDAGQLVCLDIEDRDEMKTLVYFEELPKLEALAP
ncbi:MAG: DUF5335 family protein [Myxococcales bacterium]|nr:DUF5335 family protein [Myxococcales bacterium]